MRHASVSMPFSAAICNLRVLGNKTRSYWQPDKCVRVGGPFEGLEGRLPSMSSCIPVFWAPLGLFLKGESEDFLTKWIFRTFTCSFADRSAYRTNWWQCFQYFSFGIYIWSPPPPPVHVPAMFFILLVTGYYHILCWTLPSAWRICD
jgi:hypothetical protein